MNKTTKLWLIIATSALLLGLIIFGGAMTKLNWDFKKLSTSKYETNRHEINEPYNDISIVTNTADILLLPSETGTTEIVCYEQTNIKHSVVLKDGTLSIQAVDTRKWYDYIGIHFDTPKITVYLPKAQYGAISVTSSTGFIRVENVTCGALDLSVSTGKITLSGITCDNDISINVSTGKTSITNATCKNLTSSGNTGDISLTNVIASERFSIKRSTGDVKFDSCDAGEIFVKTDTGDVKGTLLSEKVFIYDTDTGKVDLPQTITGGRCELITDTGDIKIELKE